MVTRFFAFVSKAKHDMSDITAIYITALILTVVSVVFMIVHNKAHDKKVKEYYERISRLYPNSIRKGANTPNYREYVYGVSENEWKMRERAEMRRIEAKRVETKRRELEAKYPNGYRLWTEEYGNISSNSINHEDKVRQLDEAAAEEAKSKSWLESQTEFAKYTRSLYKHAGHFGCYVYNYSILYRALRKERIEGKADSSFKYGVGEVEGNYKVWQFFCYSYCADESLDYSLCKPYSDNYDVAQEVLNGDFALNEDSYTETIVKLVEAVGHNAVVFIASSGASETDAFCLDIQYFSSLIGKLETSGIKYTMGVEQLAETLRQDVLIVVIELVTSHEQMRKTVEEITSECKSLSPRMVYISVMKEMSTQEMAEIIKKKRKEKEERDRIEKEERLNAHTREFKEKREEILRLLENNNIKWFYHFTDRRNIESIKQNGGLFSWKYLHDNSIDIPNAGGDELSRSLDSRHNLQDFVRLSFCSDHPMKYRKECEGADIVLLRISVEVATFKSTVFSDMNAADNAHSHGTEMENLEKVDFEAVKKTYVSREDGDFKAHQAEVMVKTFVPLRYILNINDF